MEPTLDVCICFRVERKCVMKVRMIIMMCITAILLTACSSDGEQTEWEKYARLDAQESVEELYEAAKKEEVLQIYTVSSRVFDVVESFQNEYPGLLVEATYYRAEEIRNKLHENAEAGTYDCDLIFTTNGDGNMTGDLIPGKLAYKYIPDDFAEKMRKGGNEEYVSILLEVPLLTYNSEVYGDEAPISNWWELTDAKWKGKLYVTDPTKSNISYTVFSMFMQNAEMLEEAYQDYFGESFSSADGANAGEVLLRMLVENDMQILSDSDDVANMVAAPGTGADGIGLLNASKLRLNERGYTLKCIERLAPFPGVINPANIMVAGGARNINSAKLFIRWMLGEADGTGEGYKPFLGEGAWPAREDVSGGDERNLDEMGVIYTDEKYAAENRESFLEFWGRL